MCRQPNVQKRYAYKTNNKTRKTYAGKVGNLTYTLIYARDLDNQNSGITVYDRQPNLQHLRRNVGNPTLD